MENNNYKTTSFTKRLNDMPPIISKYDNIEDISRDVSTLKERIDKIEFQINNDIEDINKNISTLKLLIILVSFISIINLIINIIRF